MCCAGVGGWVGRGGGAGRGTPAGNHDETPRAGGAACQVAVGASRLARRRRSVGERPAAAPRGSIRGGAQLTSVDARGGMDGYAVLGWVVGLAVPVRWRRGNSPPLSGCWACQVVVGTRNLGWLGGRWAS
jgi:hypothetical protein